MFENQFLKIKPKSSLPMLLFFLSLIFGFVFYATIIKPGQVNQYEITSDIQKELLRFRTFKNLQLNFSVFDRLEFRSLSIFGETPVKPVPGGKVDLFAP